MLPLQGKILLPLKTQGGARQLSGLPRAAG